MKKNMVTVSSDTTKLTVRQNYISLLQSNLLPELDNDIFQHDGALFYTSCETKVWMKMLNFWNTD